MRAGHNFLPFMEKLKTAPGAKPLAHKIKDTSYILGISQASVRRLIERGDLKAIRKLRHTLVTAESIQHFAETK